MDDTVSLVMDHTPAADQPILIAGFSGWGNAMGLSSHMAAYLIRKLKAAPFARINPDLFFRYDEARPKILVDRGRLKRITPPEGFYHHVHLGFPKKDILIFRSDEPQLKWHRFTSDFLSVCRLLKPRLIVTIGSMFDSVLHTERIISGIASDDDLFATLTDLGIQPVEYQGPGAVHALIQSEAEKAGFRCLSLWAHCPFYLEDTVHFGLLSTLGKRLGKLGGFTLDTGELDVSWDTTSGKIEMLVQTDPKVRDMVSMIRKGRSPARPEPEKASGPKGEKVIRMDDFREPK